MCIRSGIPNHVTLIFTSVFIVTMLTAGCTSTDEVRPRSTSSALVLEDINLSLPLNVQVARLPGVFLSRSGELRIRREQGPPLIVVDGTQMAVGGLSFLDPADIARIEVVKGPATAFYGQRGMRGVIVVTTKHEAAVRRR